ncbi:hypothetical protein D3C76_1280500 [compost metagenome]
MQRVFHQLAINHAVTGLPVTVQHEQPFILKIAPQRGPHVLTGIGPVGIHPRMKMLVGFAPPGVVFDMGGERINPVMDRLFQQHGAVLVAVLIDVSHDRQQRDDGDDKQH